MDVHTYWGCNLFFWLNRKIAEAANVHAKRQSEQLQVQLMSVACSKRRFGILKVVNRA